VKVIGGKEYVLPKKNVYTPVAPEEKPSFPEAKLCLFLGLLFGPFGVLIAAIIAKAPGVIESLKGMGIFFIIAVILAICIM